MVRSLYSAIILSTIKTKTIKNWLWFTNQIYFYGTNFKFEFNNLDIVLNLKNLYLHLRSRWVFEILNGKVYKPRWWVYCMVVSVPIQFGNNFKPIFPLNDSDYKHNKYCSKYIFPMMLLWLITSVNFKIWKYFCTNTF